MQAAADRADPQSQARIGEVLDIRHSKGSVCWASRLATRSMCRPNSGPPQRNTVLSSIGFLWSRTFKVLGCSSFSAQGHGSVFPSRDSTFRNRTIRTRTRRCHVAVFHATLGHLRCRRDAGLGQFAIPDGRMWFAECHLNSGLSPLGQQLTSPRSCCHDGQVFGGSHGLQTSRRAVFRASGVDAAEWGTLLTSLPRALATFGWQHVASLVVEERFVKTVVVSRASPVSPGNAPLARRSSFWPPNHFALVAAPAVRLSFVQGAPAASSSPSSPHSLSSRACRCDRPLDCLGHHRASCSRAGVLGRRGFALETAVAWVCRKAGARVSVNVFFRDLDLPIGAMDQRPDRGDR